MIDNNRLYNKDFLVLSVIMFLAYCNIAAFFQFHEYLSTLPIAPESFGLLIALFSLSVLVVRPLISLFLNPSDAKRWITISSCLVIASLILYNLAETFWSMAAIRILHGAAYVVLATAVLSRIVECIPQEKSGQAFGLLSAVTLLPYAVIPPFMGLLTKWTGGFDRVLDLSALAMVPIFPMLTLLDDSPVSISHGAGERSTWKDVVENFKDYRVLLMLFLSLVVWTTFTPVFFFLQGYGSKIGISNPGWFLTLSTFTEIMVRLSAGHIFDKLDKSKLLVFSLMWLTVGYWALIYASWPTAFYAMGLWLGIGWGVAMPVLSAALFDISQPKLRALNTNLGMEMFQGGFFLGPLVGGAILLQWGYTALYLGCAVLTALGMFSALFLGRIGKDNKV